MRNSVRKLFGIPIIIGLLLIGLVSLKLAEAQERKEWILSPQEHIIVWSPIELTYLSGAEKIRCEFISRYRDEAITEYYCAQTDSSKPPKIILNSEQMFALRALTDELKELFSSDVK